MGLPEGRRGRCLLSFSIVALISFLILAPDNQVVIYLIFVLIGSLGESSNVHMLHQW